MSDAAAKAVTELAFEAAMAEEDGEDEVDDHAYVMAPVDVDVTHAIMSQARLLELQARQMLGGKGEGGARLLEL